MLNVLGQINLQYNTKGGGRGVRGHLMYLCKRLSHSPQYSPQKNLKKLWNF